MDLINLTLGQGGAIGLLGYAVVFLGLVLLMIVVMIMAGIFKSKAKKAAAAAPAAAPVEKAAPAVTAEKAPGSAGNIALYDTDPKDAAMIMAIVADKMGKPVNELRFKSIKEVK